MEIKNYRNGDMSVRVKGRSFYCEDLGDEYSIDERIVETQRVGRAWGGDGVETRDVTKWYCHDFADTRTQAVKTILSIVNA